MTGTNRVKVGIICSTAGGAFRTIFDLANQAFGSGIQFHMVTDRPCRVEEFCDKYEIPHVRISSTDSKKFCTEARDYFRQNQIDCVLLFFTKLVDKALYDSLNTFNIHPALLPAFPGLNSVVTARDSKVKIMGATLHKVTEGVDTGPIEAQVASPVPAQDNLENWQRISYIHKVILGFYFLERLQTKSEGNASSVLSGPALLSPGFSMPESVKALNALIKREGFT